MAINATTPATISATFDKWLFQANIYGTGCVEFGKPGPAPAIGATFWLRRYRDRPEDNVPEVSPLAEHVTEIPVADLNALAAQYPSVATAMTALVAAVEEVAAARNAL